MVCPRSRCVIRIPERESDDAQRKMGFYAHLRARFSRVGAAFRASFAAPALGPVLVAFTRPNHDSVSRVGLRLLLGPRSRNVRG